MNRRLRVLPALLLALAWASLSRAQPGPDPAVVFSIEEWVHWAPALTAYAPAFTLYDNRDLIFYNLNSKRYEYVRLTEGECARLQEEVIPKDLAMLQRDYSRAMATCQNYYFFYFGGAPQRNVSVYGHPTMSGSFLDYEIPRSLRRCFATVAAYRNCRAVPWLPEKIEVLAREMKPSDQEYVDWPAGWPDLHSPDTIQGPETHSVFLPQDLYDELLALLDQSKRAVMMNGKPMALSHRLPIPGEEVFEQGSGGLYEEPNDTPLHHAAARGDLDLVKFLVESGADVNARNHYGRTPLHYAAVSGQREVAEFLLAGGAAVNANDRDGQTPLHETVLYDRADAAQVLLAHGANVNATGRDHKTPLLLAAEYGHGRIAQVFLAHGADIDARTSYGNTPLLCALDYREPNVAELLLAHGADVNAVNSAGDTALHYASDNALAAVADELIARGADVDARNDANDTPLYNAARDGAKQVAERLLTGGATAGAAKPDGRTALHAAAWRGSTEIVTLLLVHAAEVNARTAEDHTPLDYALMAGRDDTARALQAAGAQPGGGETCTPPPDAAP